MGSRREEERNEKIIRGLMKLPPNRRCINCNSLGPQYVCTNFWTFVCMTCSGIHREFTHRVKSVSMSKFTSQEVEALQNGGNQRAREIFLRDWDHERQRLPGNSNVDKVREFIKSVYVDKKYAGGKSHDKPPRDLQRLKSNEEDTRRASSYHSYSQSPPYDFQYEDRRYGKQAGVLTRKPGSDRGYYVGKMSSFICSPTRSNERTLEDRFANEGSVSRVSSGGDLFSAGSPNFQKESITQSPSNALGEDAHHRIDLFSERSASLGSAGSFDSNSISARSYNSETEQAAASRQNVVPTVHKASGSYGSLDQFKAPVVPESNASASPPIDLFQLQETPPPPSAHFSEAPSSDPSASANSHQKTYTTMPVSLDLFAGISQQQSVNSLGHNTVDSSSQKNEGWATFDAQPIASTQGSGNLTSSVSPQFLGSPEEFDKVSSTNASMQWPPFQNSSVQGPSSASDPWKINGQQYDQSTSAPQFLGSPEEFDKVSSTNTGMQWPPFQNSSAQGPSPVSDLWKDIGQQYDQSTSASTQGAQNLTSSVSPQFLGSTKELDKVSRMNTGMQWPPFQNSSAQGSSPVSDLWKDDGKQYDQSTSYPAWNAFSSSATQFPPGESNQASEPHEFNVDQNRTSAPYEGIPGLNDVAEAMIDPPYTPSVNPMVEANKSYEANHKSTNPFDLPFDSEMEPGDMFLDMGSLQDALPTDHLPPSFIAGVSAQWFPHEPATNFIPVAPQGGLAYMAGQAPSSQLENVPAQGPVTSIGGNPFA